MNKELTGRLSTAAVLSGHLEGDPALEGSGLLPAGPPGKTGPVWLPEVDGEGDLTWTLDDGQTEPDPVNIKGPPGVADYSTVLPMTTFTHEQAQATTVWEIQHNLGFFPSVAAVTYGGNHVIGEVRYINENSLTVTFTVELSGYAYLS